MRSSRCICIHIVLAALFLAVLTTTCNAQTPRFGVKPITGYPLTNVKDVIPHGINSHAEVVGEITFTDSSETHAFLYVTTARLGLSVGLHDLHELAELSGSHSVAWGINEFS